MKTKTQVLKDYPEFKTLINSVISLIGLDSIQDVNNYGINAGFNGFIYYIDTFNFAKKHRKSIIKLLNDEYMEFGYKNVLEMVSSFRCIDLNDKENLTDFFKYMGLAKIESCSVTNTMAWYAAETVCRWFEN